MNRHHLSESAGMVVFESLPMVVAGGARGAHHTPRAAILRLKIQCLLSQVGVVAQQALIVLAWLLCLVGVSTTPGVRLHRWPWDDQVVLGFWLFLAVVSGVLAVRDHIWSQSGAGPLLAALALVVWRLGLHTPGSSEPWCVAVLKAAGERGLGSNLDSRAACGLVLLDDMLRVILRFVASTPLEAWPFALANQKTHDLWVNDNDWWEGCYGRTGWMRLPSKAKLPGAAAVGGSSRQLLREAMLWASVMAEALGTMAVLPPRCATASWVAAPCVASTLLVVSCAPWLPRHSNLVVVEMLQLMRSVSRFAIYFQAIWVVVMAFLLQPADLAICALPKDHILLCLLEAGAMAVLYAMVAGHLWAATMRCRAASPLYAVPAEDVVSDTPLRNRPLYCGNLGLVEGSHAPTRICDWEDVPNMRWHDRYTLRRCAESLAAREARLLSHLDALDLRITEAELEVHGAPSAAPPGATVNGILLSVAVTLGVVVMHSRRSSCYPHTISSVDVTGAIFETMLWASIALRAGQCWYASATHRASAWASYGCTPHAEAAALRQQACTLHRSLAETQWTICRLEVQLERLGIAVQRRCVPQMHGVSSMKALLLCWLGPVFALAFVSASR